MKVNSEYEKFDKAMDKILCADPKTVKEAMEREAHAHAMGRRERGERKRGRKKTAKGRSSPSDHAVSDMD